MTNPATSRQREPNNDLLNALFGRQISPLLELGAYERLWLEPKSSFKSVASLFRGRSDALPTDFVTEREAQAHSKEVLDIFAKSGVVDFGVRIHGSIDYPERLRDAVEPVEMLYYMGWWDLAESPKSIAVVGTRAITDDGARRTRKLVRSLVENGYTIVSGLAKGIDSVAHETTIECGGRTIAVIGTPIHEAYPKENSVLQRKIARDHLLISQVPVLRYERQNYRVNRFFFPERNKTMSALTKATVIVEASETSGTLIQAEAALSQGRDLFILDSCFHRADLTWPAKFLARGAIRVSTVDDILLHLESNHYSALAKD